MCCLCQSLQPKNWLAVWRRAALCWMAWFVQRVLNTARLNGNLNFGMGPALPNPPMLKCSLTPRPANWLIRCFSPHRKARDLLSAAIHASQYKSQSCRTSGWWVRTTSCYIRSDARVSSCFWLRKQQSLNHNVCFP